MATVNFGNNPWGVWVPEKKRSYVISKIMAPDPNQLVPTDPASGMPMAGYVQQLVTTYPVDWLEGGISTRLGEYGSLEAAQQAIRADAQ